MYLYVSFATIIFDIIVTFMLFDACLKWKNTKLITKISIGVFIFIGTVFNNILIKDLKLTIIISLLILFITSIIGFEGKIGKKTLVVSGYMLLIIISDLFTTAIEMIFLNENTNALLLEESTGRMIGMLLSKPITLLLIRILILILRRKNIQIYKQCSIVLMSVPIVNIVLIISIVNFYESIHLNNINMVYIAAICILYNTIIVFYLFERIARITILENKCSILENQMTIQEEHVRSKEIYSNKIRAYKHDIKIHFQTLYSMLCDGYNDRAQRYLKETGLVDDVEYNRVYTGNIALDSILNGKLDEAEQYGISLDIKCLIPSDMDMSDIDIAVLFGNLMDNAIESCQRSNNAEKKITVILKYNKNRLSFFMKNTAQEVKKEGERFVSMKKGKADHGIGLENIEDVILKYEGICKMVQEDGYFKTYMTLFV